MSLKLRRATVVHHTEHSTICEVSGYFKKIQTNKQHCDFSKCSLHKMLCQVDFLLGYSKQVNFHQYNAMLV